MLATLLCTLLLAELNRHCIQKMHFRQAIQMLLPWKILPSSSKQAKMHQRMQRLFKKTLSMQPMCPTTFPSLPSLHATYVSPNVRFAIFSSCNVCVLKRSLLCLLLMQPMCPRTFASLPSFPVTYVS